MRESHRGGGVHAVSVDVTEQHHKGLFRWMKRKKKRKKDTEKSGLKLCSVVVHLLGRFCLFVCLFVLTRTVAEFSAPNLAAIRCQGVEGVGKQLQTLPSHQTLRESLRFKAEADANKKINMSCRN